MNKFILIELAKKFTDKYIRSKWYQFRIKRLAFKGLFETYKDLSRE